VVAVRDERRAVETPPAGDPDLRRDLVPDEADGARHRKRAELRQLLRLDEPRDRLPEREHRRDECYCDHTFMNGCSPI
jgi:hypothetical protein